MKKMSILTIVLIALRSAVIFAETVEELTFSNAVDLALQRNSKVHQYEEKLLSKQCDQTTAKGAYFPVVNVAGSYNRIDEPLSFNLDPIRDALINVEANNQVQFQSLNSKTAIPSGSPAYTATFNAAKAMFDSRIPHFIDTLKDMQYPSASVQIVQPLFTGMRLTASVRAAKADRQVAYYELERIKNDVVKETIIQCLNFVIVKDLIDIRLSVLNGMKQHLQKAAILSEQGMIAKYHYLRAKVAVAEAERNLDSEQNLYELVKLAIKENCIIADSVSIVMKNSITYQSISDSVDKFIEMAQKNQPLFSVVSSNRGMALQKLTAAKGILYPQVSAYGKYELFPDYLSAMEPNWVIGVQANLTLFSGGKNISNIRSATHLVKEIDQIDSTLKRDITLWINKAYREMHSADNRYVHLDADLELATENLHQCQSRFENGYGTSLEVIDAQLVLERNKVERLVTLGDYYKALTELYTAAGKPSEAIKYITGDNK